MGRTVVSRSDALSFTTERRVDGSISCWAVYRDWRFRIEGDGTMDTPWKTWIVRPHGTPVTWHTVGPFYEPQDDYREWTTKFKGWSRRRVIRKVIRWIDAEIDTEKKATPKWPESRN